jgi:hypothetical protein
MPSEGEIALPFAATDWLCFANRNITTLFPPMQGHQPPRERC